MPFTRLAVALTTLVSAGALALTAAGPADAAATSSACSRWIGHSARSTNVSYGYKLDTFASRICISLKYTTHNRAITKLTVQGHSGGQYYDLSTSVTEYSQNKSRSKTYKTSYGKPWDNTTKGYVTFGGTKTLASHQYMWFKAAVTMSTDEHRWSYTQSSPAVHVN